MKHILTTAFLTAFACIAQADDRSIPKKARDTKDTVVEKTKEAAHDTKDAIVGAARHAGRATRVVWGKTKAYLSDDVPTYREGAHATLAGLAREIADVKARTPSAAPTYFHTRLLALDQQHAHLAMRLAELSREELRVRSSGPHQDFDQCLGDLEQAIDQAENGANLLSKITLKEARVFPTAPEKLSP